MQVISELSHVGAGSMQAPGSPSLIHAAAGVVEAHARANRVNAGDVFWGIWDADPTQLSLMVSGAMLIHSTSLPAAMASLIVHAPSHPKGGSNGVSDAALGHPLGQQFDVLAVIVAGSWQDPPRGPHEHVPQTAGSHVGASVPSNTTAGAYDGHGGALALSAKAPTHNRRGSDQPADARGAAHVKHPRKVTPGSPFSTHSGSSIGQWPQHALACRFVTAHVSSQQQGSRLFATL
jgi:hypothetical protein